MSFDYLKMGLADSPCRLVKVMADIGGSGLAIIEEARLPRDVSSAWKTYFREHVPKSEEEFRDLPHKPVSGCSISATPAALHQRPCSLQVLS
jgi:hypothetical protein